MTIYDIGASVEIAIVAAAAVGIVTTDAIRRKEAAKGRNEHGRRVVAQGKGPMAPWGVET